jgi:hypothetical protein
MAMPLSPGCGERAQKPLLLRRPDNSGRCDQGSKLLIPRRAWRERGIRWLPSGSMQRIEKPFLTVLRLPNSPQIERRQRGRRKR